MINFFSEILGILMKFSYGICNNYGVSIIIFTAISRIILFPINILIQKNSIKMVRIRPKIEELKYKIDNKETFMEKQIELYEKEKYRPSLGVLPLLIQIPIILGLIKVIENPSVYIGNIKETIFFGIDLNKTPDFQDLSIPIVAGVSAILLCVLQNISNVLQKEENIYSKLFTGIITTAFTVYFVFLVPNGVGLYWILGNVLAIFTMYLLNFMYPPKKFINYDEFEYWKSLNIEKNKQNIINKKRSKQDYKKFFKDENIKNMKLIFFSEQNGFYKYFSGVINYVLDNSEIQIHYITSDPNDNIFENNNSKLKSYYIAKEQLIPLFMKIEADIVVMTTPDLQKYYLKRSIVRKDVEYIYMDHGMTSLNLTLRKGALDYFDTIFVNGPQQKEEMRALETLRNLKSRNLIEVGFPYLDDLILKYNNKNVKNDLKTILIAPSHQKDNILDSCICEILDELLKKDYKIIVRPHPQYIIRKKENLDKLFDIYKDKFNENFCFELDFSSNKTVYDSDLVITDWSGIGMEFSLTTNKPTLFINTKMKVMNEDYKKINIEPIDIILRNEIGKSIEKNEISDINNIVDNLLKNKEGYYEKINKAKEKYLYNLGSSSQIAGEYIINRINKSKRRKDK